MFFNAKHTINDYWRVRVKKKTLTIISDELGKMRSYNEQLKSLFKDNIIIKEL